MKTTIVKTKRHVSANGPGHLLSPSEFTTKYERLINLASTQGEVLLDACAELDEMLQCSPTYPVHEMPERIANLERQLLQYRLTLDTFSALFFDTDTGREVRPGSDRENVEVFRLVKELLANYGEASEFISSVIDDFQDETLWPDVVIASYREMMEGHVSGADEKSDPAPVHEEPGFSGVEIIGLCVCYESDHSPTDDELMDAMYTALGDMCDELGTKKPGDDTVEEQGEDETEGILFYTCGEDNDDPQDALDHMIGLMSDVVLKN